MARFGAKVPKMTHLVDVSGSLGSFLSLICRFLIVVAFQAKIHRG